MLDYPNLYKTMNTPKLMQNIDIVTKPTKFPLKTAFVTAIFVTTLSPTISTTTHAKVSNQVLTHSQWHSLLSKHVKSINGGKATQVNYAGFQKDRAILNRYLKTLSAVSKSDFNKLPKNDQLAFLINTYNAQTVALVLTKYPNLKSIKDTGSLFSSPWKKKFVPLFGTTYSLDDIEHKMIRTNKYAEPRIHFAVNCASIGCPALLPQAYTGKKLNNQLERATINFLSDKSRNYAKGDRLYLSSIFKWYGKDFKKGWAGYQTLNQFLGQYAKPLGLNPSQIKSLKEKNIKISYLKYDWKLNKVQ